MNESIESPRCAARCRSLRAGLVAIAVLALGGLVALAFHWLVTPLETAKVRALDGETLVVNGPAKVTIAHGDRSRPCEHVFRIFNPLRRSVLIRQVTTSCSCTIATPIEGLLRPGGERHLKLQVHRFDPYETAFSTTATIESDAGTLEVKLAGTVPPTSKVLYKPQVLYLKPQCLAEASEHTLTLRLLKTCALEAAKQSIRVIGGPARIGPVTAREDGPHFTELSITVTLPALAPNTPPWDRIEINAGCEDVAIPIVVLGSEFAGS